MEAAEDGERQDALPYSDGLQSPRSWSARGGRCLGLSDAAVGMAGERRRSGYDKGRVLYVRPDSEEEVSYFELHCRGSESGIAGGRVRR